MHTNRFIAAVRQGAVLALMAVLALAPFLHGHLGASHVNGFHVDGLDTAHTAYKVPSVQSQAEWSSHAASEEESPAMGVTLSLPKSVDPLHWVMVWVGWGLWLGLAKKVSSLVPRPLVRVWPASHRDASGWPPPALAPPL